MKNKFDRIISALYLAKSDNREKMLADLILNILYSVNETVNIDSIIDLHDLFKSFLEKETKNQS